MLYLQDHKYTGIAIKKKFCILVFLEDCRDVYYGYIFSKWFVYNKYIYCKYTDLNKYIYIYGFIINQISIFIAQFILISKLKKLGRKNIKSVL